TENQTLKLARSIDQGLTFSQPDDLYFFTGEVSAYDLKVDRDQAFYLVYNASREVYFTCSRSGGREFSRPQLLAVSGEAPCLAFFEQQLLVAWAAEGEIVWTRSADQGTNWLPPEQLLLTGETLAVPSVAIDKAANAYLTFVGTNTNQRIERLYFTALPSAEPVVCLYETPDQLTTANIITTPWALLVIWQTAYGGRKEPFGRLSLDQGRHFGSVKHDLPVDLLYCANRWFVPDPPAAGWKELNFSPPPSPQFLTASGTTTIEINYRPRANEPAISKFEIAGRKDFPPNQTWSFDRLEDFSSPGTAFRLPVDLPEGKYYIRLSAFDGLTAGQPSPPVAFAVDRTAPVIGLTVPTAETSETAEVLVSGTLDGPAALTLNGRPVSVEAGGAFQQRIVLRLGENILWLVATDEAGNTAGLSKKIFFAPVLAGLSVIKPQENNWYKPGSTIYLQVSINDPQAAIADETEADILVADRLLDDKIVYAADDRALTGFVRLPADLGDGPLPAKIRLKDLTGKSLEGKFTVRIDG
ncbi:MAG TPA: hypothetical protein VMT55_00620, partial [Candidatus Sulfotelmatobacter sp.]|nr:hypothetical protein [Candidatus Sulfotelmatobacter sp.]